MRSCSVRFRIFHTRSCRSSVQVLAHTLNARRFQSTRGSSSFQLDALPFYVSADTASASFDDWARKDQGLTSILAPRNVRIAAAYCPVWSFSLNVRFGRDTGKGRKDYTYKPPIFQVYGAQQVIHLPGLAAYSGYTYRRSLVDPLHNTTLLFLGDKVQPFGKWMLRDMELSNGQKLSVFPDPWNTTKARALGLVIENLQGMTERDDIIVETQVCKARRVYMPTYVVDYTVLGVNYQAFVSGCEQASGVSGISHQVWSGEIGFQPPSPESTGTFLSQAWYWLGRSDPRTTASVLAVLIQSVGSLLSRLAVRIPIIGAIAGITVGFRKILLPWWTQSETAAEWERQREHEAVMEDEDLRYHEDDFEDFGGAARYFSQNRKRILRHLGGEHRRETGQYDWYAEWEAWARKQWEEQQSNQDYSQSRAQGRQRKTQQSTKSAPEYNWPFNPNDPYSVLGVSRGSSRKEISAAFRREMLKWHPDTIGPGSSEALRERALERSKLITEAYKKIKAAP